LPDKCVKCPHWQGNSNAEWGDCYRVIKLLEPRLLKCKSITKQRFKVPFDPHDVKYFMNDTNFVKLYRKLQRRKNLPKGVRIHKVKELDTTFNRQTQEFGTLKPVNIYYFQTHRDSKCLCNED